ncbi:hypothetical protein ACHAWO_005000 [Cyclotella atomus]|uniref:Uncharacterized protein n=1 Tax=Cyclotella atomus TaxID=382360 RepID=A0ABD3PVX3_9STRA
MFKSALILAAALASASAFAPVSRPAISRTVVRAEPMDYEKEMAKLQKECEERLDDKVAELMSNIETVGQQKK